jgi:RimJ/RimL family protein N-acetyltransferase
MRPPLLLSIRPTESARVLLRPVTPADVTQRYCDWLNDPAVNQYLETRFVRQTLDGIAGYVQAQLASGDSALLAIVQRATAQHVGNLRIGAIDWHHRTATVALFIGDRSAWGAGLGSDAIRLATDVAFAQLGLRKLTARCYAVNHASIRAFERAGWLHEGRQRQQFISNEGVIDGVWLGIAAPAAS